MKKILLSAVMAPFLLTATLASANDSFALLSNAKVNGEVRVRYENVDVENSGKKDADAFTIRATLGLDATLFGVNNLTMKVDGTTVQSIGAEHYNSGSNGIITHEIVKDPQQTRFSQAYLQYKLNKTAVKVGRQLIMIDNERFVGAVDWRQMMQSFDAVSINDATIPGLNLFGAYIYSYVTVFDEPTWDSKSIILNGSYKVNDMIKVTAYDYMISSQKVAYGSAYGSDTYGLALTGDLPVANAKINYHAEYAKQGDTSFKTIGSTKQEHDAYYYNLDVLANISGILVGAGYEVLSGSNGVDGKTPFSTPMATLHKFNGWADMFLTTPTGGLCDATASFGYTTPAFGKALVVYHNYETDAAMASKSDLGTELDILYTNNIPGVKGLNGLIKAAYYQAGEVSGFTADTNKFWLQLDYKF